MIQEPAGEGGQKILIVDDGKVGEIVAQQLLVSPEIAEARKELELQMARDLSKTRENRRRRHPGEAVPVVCSVCKNGCTTLYNKTLADGNVEKRCGSHR